MVGASAELRVDDRDVKALFARLRAAGDDLTEPMDRIGAAIAADVQRRFEEGVGPGGEVWPVSLRAKLTSGQTLVDTGRLRDSITWDPGPKSVRVGTNVIYAAIHQFGGTIKPKSADRLAFTLADGTTVFAKQVDIPARPFLGIDDEQRDIVAGEIAAWLAEVAGPEATRPGGGAP